MKILFLLRQGHGGHTTLCRALEPVLPEYGIEATVLDASAWMPSATGRVADKQVADTLRQAAKGHDAVIAMGYRTAWACAEAFGLKVPWAYYAYDIPKTTKAPLIDRLAHARIGLCSSRAVYKALDEVYVVGLTVVTPCCEFPEGPPTQEEARHALGIDQDARLVVAIARDVPDRRLDLLGHLTLDPSVLVKAVTTGQPGPELARFAVDPGPDRLLWLSAADAVLVPSERAGFSMVAAEAMSRAKPVVMRDSGGLHEMGVRSVSIELFAIDDEATPVLNDVFHSPVHAAGLGQAARARAYDRFNVQDCARLMSEIAQESLA